MFSFYGELLNDITNMSNIWEKQYIETVALANRKCLHLQGKVTQLLKEFYLTLSRAYGNFECCKVK